MISTTCENQIVGKVSFGNKSSLEYCGFGGYSVFLREIKCKIGYECFSFHRRIREESFVIYPTEGTSVFIEDYEHFRIPDDVVVVGMENGANFQRIRGRKYLFEDLKVLFVSRYPQSTDLHTWLQMIHRYGKGARGVYNWIIRDGLILIQ